MTTLYPLYQPTHYDIHITPTFTKDGTAYTFEGLNEETRSLFRFTVLTLRKYFGRNFQFERKKGEIIIATLSTRHK